jgi:hypothetical protein
VEVVVAHHALACMAGLDDNAKTMTGDMAAPVDIRCASVKTRLRPVFAPQKRETAGQVFPLA